MAWKRGEPGADPWSKQRGKEGPCREDGDEKKRHQGMWCQRHYQAQEEQEVRKKPSRQKIRAPGPGDKRQKKPMGGKSVTACPELSSCYQVGVVPPLAGRLIRLGKGPKSMLPSLKEVPTWARPFLPSYAPLLQRN